MSSARHFASVGGAMASRRSMMTTVRDIALSTDVNDKVLEK